MASHPDDPQLPIYQDAPQANAAVGVNPANINAIPATGMCPQCHHKGNRQCTSGRCARCCLSHTASNPAMKCKYRKHQPVAQRSIAPTAFLIPPLQQQNPAQGPLALNNQILSPNQPTASSSQTALSSSASVSTSSSSLNSSATTASSSTSATPSYTLSQPLPSAWGKSLDVASQVRIAKSNRKLSLQASEHILKRTFQIVWYYKVSLYSL